MKKTTLSEPIKSTLKQLLRGLYVFFSLIYLFLSYVGINSLIAIYMPEHSCVTPPMAYLFFWACISLIMGSITLIILFKKLKSVSLTLYKKAAMIFISTVCFLAILSAILTFI